MGAKIKVTEMLSRGGILIEFESLPFTSLPSAGQHPSYGICLEIKREYYQNCSVLGCVTQCSQPAAHSCEQFLQVQQIGFVTLGPLRLKHQKRDIGTLTPCIEAVA